jgi:adenylate cyclase
MNPSRTNALSNASSRRAGWQDGEGESFEPGWLSRIRWLWSLKATRVGCALTVLTGIVLLWSGGGVLERLSYDAAFPFQSGIPNEVVMVYIDAKAKENLNQPTDLPLDRHFHAQLLDRLRADGAKLVLYDLVFDRPSADPSADEEFGAAMRRNGRVVLVTDYGKQVQANFVTDGPIPTIDVLNDAAAASGLAKIGYEPGRFVRRLDTGTDSYPSASWAAATFLGAPVTKRPERRVEQRWINYYCAPGQFRAVNFDRALSADDQTAGYFRDKIVVVGAADDPADIFQTPHSRFLSGVFSNGPVSPGAAIHAMSLLNLVRGDWLKRLGLAAELTILIAWGIFITTALMLVRPWPAIGLALLLGGLFAAAAILLALRAHVWFPWAIPVAAQMPLALMWAVGFESVRRRRLRRAFGLYLSPYMADRIANSNFDPSLGGKEVEATVMFTDLQEFTKMSEALSPASVSNILITYFNRTTRVIQELNGTIIKYVGDGIMAAWGAPLPDAKHAEHTVAAALAMSRASQSEVEGRKLRTRIGINTGIFLAGNLGSEFRFDYTLIGDSTNFASRLEGLNKALGTDILISEATRSQLKNGIKVRDLGRFIVAGASKPASVFEVLGSTAEFEPEPVWVEMFSVALKHFAKGELDAAEDQFHKTIAARQGNDGPSRFYLGQIEAARRNPPTEAAWDGTVRLAEK